MKKMLSFNFLAIVCFAFCSQPISLFADAMFFDAGGSPTDKARYEQIVSGREKMLSAELKNGYRLGSHALPDPIQLRKKRIEQWKTMRSHYDPDSLPAKIEAPKPSLTN